MQKHYLIKTNIVIKQSHKFNHHDDEINCSRGTAAQYNKCLQRVQSWFHTVQKKSHLNCGDTPTAEMPLLAPLHLICNCWNLLQLSIFASRNVPQHQYTLLKYVKTATEVQRALLIIISRPHHDNTWDI